MDAPAVKLLDDPTVAAETYFLAPDRLIEGNPRQTVWIRHADPSGSFVAGIWQSEPGAWRVSYTEDEYCELLQGTSVVTDATGRALTVTTGARFVIPRGFTGTWRVVETTRKVFVIHEPAPAPAAAPAAAPERAP